MFSISDGSQSYTATLINIFRSCQPPGVPEIFCNLEIFCCITFSTLHLGGVFQFYPICKLYSLVECLSVTSPPIKDFSDVKELILVKFLRGKFLELL